MKRSYRLFLGGFVVTVLFLATLWGFALVDQSTQYYMPGRIEPSFQMEREEGALRLTLFGGSHTLDTGILAQGERLLGRFAYLLPPEAVWMARWSGEGWTLAQEQLRLWQRGEELPE